MNCLCSLFLSVFQQLNMSNKFSLFDLTPSRVCTFYSGILAFVHLNEKYTKRNVCKLTGHDV